MNHAIPDDLSFKDFVDGSGLNEMSVATMPIFNGSQQLTWHYVAH